MPAIKVGDKITVTHPIHVKGVFTKPGTVLEVKNHEDRQEAETLVGMGRATTEAGWKPAEKKPKPQTAK